MALNKMDLYEARALKDYKVTTPEDIKEIYGYDVTQLNGYSTLSEENKQLFRKFIINFYNGIGLDSRMILKLIEVNYVQMSEYVRFSYTADDGQDIYEVVGVEFKKLNEKGKYIAFKKHLFYKDVDLEKCKKYTSSFLRIDYKWGTRKEWQHIITPNKWY